MNVMWKPLVAAILLAAVFAAAAPLATIDAREIIENRAAQGNLRESTYVFQMSLASSDGLAVWEEEKTISKQGKKSAVSW